MESKNISKLKANERSEGEDLITYMNQMFQQHNWHLKKASGEMSLSLDSANDGRNKTLFPDAIIFEDNDCLRPLIGWEFKMPDTPIDDHELYENAKDKANRLGTSAFVLWNFQKCRIFYKVKNSWSKKPSREYDDDSEILIDRISVHKNANLWKKKALNVLTDLNEDLVNKYYKVAPVEFNIKGYVDTISTQLIPITAEYLSNIKDPRLQVRMREFVRNEQAELINIDEKLLNGNDGLKIISEAYSKNIIIRWINRIIFCNLIRKDYNSISDVLYEFIKSKDISALRKNINSSIIKTDFYSILHVEKDETLLPCDVINNLVEFCSYLWSVGFQNVDNNFVSQVLETIIQSTKRELMGVYTTPVPLSKLLVRLSMEKVDGDFADFTVGSGTLVKEVIDELKKFKSMEDIHNHVWASDKYLYPLQVANLSMTSSNSLNLKNIVFQHDALTLECGDVVRITNPATGSIEHLKLPRFSCIVSNLPFISSNKQSKDDKEKLHDMLDGKADLYQRIILHYKNLLEKSDDSRIGVITSNSWFKNKKSKNNTFFKTLIDNFDIKQIVYSNVAKWFDNANVVATILILSHRSKKPSKIQFIGLNTDIRDKKPEYINELSDKIIENNKSKDYEMYEYDYREVLNFLDTGVCLEALFDDLSWYKDLLDKHVLKRLNTLGKMQRGTRTGADKLFITDGLKTDPRDSHPYIKTLKGISSYKISSTDQYLFYTDLSIEQLCDEGHIKTLEYIDDISQTEDAKRMKKKHGEKWYTAESKPHYGDFITLINPDKRLFWTFLEQPAALNQRVIAFSLNKEYKEEKQLIHALLNSVISLFIFCGSGFARAEGVTDITKEGLDKLSIPNPDLLNIDEKNEILDAWEKVSKKKVINIIEQLEDPEWMNFNKIVLKSFSLGETLYDKIVNSITVLVNRREKIRIS